MDRMRNLKNIKTLKKARKLKKNILSLKQLSLDAMRTILNTIESMDLSYRQLLHKHFDRFESLSIYKDEHLLKMDLE